MIRRREEKKRSEACAARSDVHTAGGLLATDRINISPEKKNKRWVAQRGADMHGELCHLTRLYRWHICAAKQKKSRAMTAGTPNKKSEGKISRTTCAGACVNPGTPSRFYVSSW